MPQPLRSPHQSSPDSGGAEPSAPVRLFQGGRQIWLWIVLALVVRLAYLLEQGTESPLFYQPLLDEQEAVESARTLLAGRGLGAEPLFKAPGYALLLAGVMALSGEEWPWMIRLVQHLLGVILTALAFDTARRLVSAGRARAVAGALAGGLVALYGPLVRLEACVCLDLPVLFFQSAMMWALVRWASCARAGRRRAAAWCWIGAAGLFAAAAWLTRPTLTPVLPLLGGWIGFCAGQGGGASAFRPPDREGGRFSLPRALKPTALFLLFPAAAMFAIYVRNARAGEAMLLPWQGGYNFYHANRTGASGRYLIQEEFSLSASGNPTRRLAEEGWRRAVAEGKTAPAPPGRTWSAINAWWFDLARRDIAADPARWAGLMGRKLLYLVSDKEVYNYEEYDLHRALSRLLPWLPGRFGVVWPLALASLALAGRVPIRRRAAWGALWLYGAALGGAIALYYTSGRMRMPLVFPAVVLGAAGVGLLVGAARPAARTLIVYGTLFLSGAVMSWGDWWGVRSERMWHADLCRLSNAAWRSGRAEQALKFAELAAREKPDYPTIPILRGQALYALGRRQEAAEAFRESVARLPGDPVAPYNLGVILDYDGNNPEAAWKAYAEALRRDPNYRQAAWRGAVVKLRLHDTEGARKLLAPWVGAIRSGQEPPPLLRVAAIAVACASGDRDEARRLARGASEALATEIRTELARLNLSECLP